jgi:hypothetical protein
MNRFACICVVLMALTGCKTARQGIVLSVETQVFKRELADHPTTLRVEYRLGDPPSPAPRTGQMNEQSAAR